MSKSKYHSLSLITFVILISLASVVNLTEITQGQLTPVTSPALQLRSETAAGLSEVQEEVEIKGIIKRINTKKRELDIRLSAEQRGAEEVTIKVLLNRDVRIKMQGRPDGDINFFDLEKAKVVTISGRKYGEVIEANLIVLELACTLEFCPQRNCRHKCGTKPCKCPVL